MTTVADGALHEAVRAGCRRASALVRSAPDLQRQVPGLTWTAAQTAAHLVAVLRIFSDAASDDLSNWPMGTPSDPGFRARLVGFNALAVEVILSERRPLADSLDSASDTFLACLGPLPPRMVVSTPWYGEGVTRTTEDLVALALAEVTVHSVDIARACGRRWSIDPDVSRTIIRTTFRGMVPLIVDPVTSAGVDAVFEVRVRGDAPFVVHVCRGMARVSAGPAQGRVDCRLSVDPTGFLLVGYGRVSQWSQLGRGRLFAWGRRPWLGLRFRRLFVRP